MGGSGGLGYPAYQIVSRASQEGLSANSNRAHQVLHSQSRQLGKAMRIAHPGPQHPHAHVHTQTHAQTQTHTHAPHTHSHTHTNPSHPQQHHQQQFVAREFGDGVNIRATPGGVPRNETPSGPMSSLGKNGANSYPAIAPDGVTVHHPHNNNSTDGYDGWFELGTSSSQPSSSSSSQVFHSLSTPSLLVPPPPPSQQQQQTTTTTTSSGQGPQSSLPIFSTPYPDYGLTPAEQTTERLAYDSYAPSKGIDIASLRFLRVPFQK